MNNDNNGENNIYACYPSQMLDENTSKNSEKYINNDTNFNQSNAGYNQNNAGFNQNSGNFNAQNIGGNSCNSSQNGNFGNLFQNGGNMLSNIMSMFSGNPAGGNGAGGNNMMSMLGNILPNLPKNNGAGILGSLFNKNEKKDEAKPATEVNNVSSKINDFKKIKNLD